MRGWNEARSAQYLTVKANAQGRTLTEAVEAALKDVATRIPEAEEVHLADVAFESNDFEVTTAAGETAMRTGEPITVEATVTAVLASTLPTTYKPKE